MIDCVFGGIRSGQEGVLTVAATGKLVDCVASDNGGINSRHFAGLDQISTYVHSVKL
jgi:hypothetical protein